MSIESESIREDIFDLISEERERQDRLHPDQDHPDSVFLAVLMEEVGEVARAMLEDEPKQLRAELVQVAAVCVRMLERGDPEKPADKGSGGARLTTLGRGAL